MLSLLLPFNILILSLIVLGCFINITGYFISIYLINKYEVEKNNSLNIIEIIICFCCIIVIIIGNLGVLGIFIFRLP